MIVVENLSKSYPTEHGRRYVLRNLNLTLPTGAGIGILGRNGAGKTTLLRLLGNIARPDSGRVLTNQLISWPVASGSGFVRNLNAVEGVRFMCHMMGFHGPEMREKIDYVRKFADIGDYFDLPVSTYSPGMRSRVAFGATMAFDFDYYLIDEVLAAGDPFFRAKAANTFKEKMEKAGVIMATHNMKEIKDHCSMVIYIENGEARVYDDVDEAVSMYQEMVKKANQR